MFHPCEALSDLQGDVQVVRLGGFHLLVVFQSQGDVSAQFVALRQVLVCPHIVRLEDVGIFIMAESLLVVLLLLHDVSGLLVDIGLPAMCIDEFLVEGIGFFHVFFLQEVIGQLLREVFRLEGIAEQGVFPQVEFPLEDVFFFLMAFPKLEEPVEVLDV